MPELRDRDRSSLISRGEKRKRSLIQDSTSGHTLRRRPAIVYRDSSDDSIEDPDDLIAPEEIDEVVTKRSFPVKLRLRANSGSRRSSRLHGEIAEDEIWQDPSAFEVRSNGKESQDEDEVTTNGKGRNGVVKVEALLTEDDHQPTKEEKFGENPHESGTVHQNLIEQGFGVEEDEEEDDEEPIVRRRPSSFVRPRHKKRMSSKHRPTQNTQIQSEEEYHNESSPVETELSSSDAEDVADPSAEFDRPRNDRRALQEFIVPDESDLDRPRRVTRTQLRRRQHNLDDELQNLAQDVLESPRKLRERAGHIDYTIPPPPPLPSPRRRTVRDVPKLFPTAGPFGGGSVVPAIFGNNLTDLGAVGGANDSDSSDDENKRKGAAAVPSGAGQLNIGPVDSTAATPLNFGRVHKKQNLADADPLGVDLNVSFESVGGMENHIQQLKEMISLPLLYPEIFQRFGLTPPRGVLFHGPPGTGKTLLARALAASCSTGDRKITFYMRKGADCLSKWVGEAERQLRLLFDEAKASQPSIIFFDEIDGLAPVRSSKQEQIHASIVSTLLALMDGMDGRGQVIIIGATNRPDSVDPALRRPGRFDREFYFPLPNTTARKSIIDIHTKSWEPPLEDSFRQELATQTKGYGGADLRALCTEAALNAVQRQYPQIYQSSEKLLIDPAKINVQARDFMRSMKSR